jgi:hypothetical protein
MGKESENSEKEVSSEERERIQILADRVKLLFGFCTELIPDIDLLERTAKGAGGKEDMAMSAAPILGAVGLDYEEVNMEWGLRRKRAEALANLLRVLDETEKERAEFESKKIGKAHHRAEVARIFGV